MLFIELFQSLLPVLKKLGDKCSDFSKFMLVSMLGFLFISLLSGYPVAFTISGVSLLFLHLLEQH